MIRREPIPDANARRLWQDRDFLLFWLAHVVSLSGTLVSSVALLLLIFQLTNSAFLTSLTSVFQVLPYLLFGFVAGAMADRVDRKRLMVVSDVLNTLFLGSIPLAAALHLLTLPHIFAVSLLSATAFVWFDAANWGAVPALVGRERVMAANSAIWTADSFLTVAVPAVAGGLIAVVGAAATISLDALSYAFSAIALLLTVRAFHSARAESTTLADSLVQRMRADIREGLQFIWRHPLVRMLTLTGFGSSMTGGAIGGLLVIYAVRGLGLSEHDGRIGLLYTAGAVGSLVITPAIPWLAKRVPVGAITLVGLTASPILIVALVLAPNFAAGCVIYALWAMAYATVIQNGISFRQMVTPESLLSRVNTTARMIAWGGQPFGAALGGVLAELSDVRTAFLIMATAVAVSAVAGWFSPLRYGQVKLDA